MSLSPQPMNGGDFETVAAILALSEWNAQPKWDGHRAIISDSSIVSRHGKPLPMEPSLSLEAIEWADALGFDLDAELMGPRDEGEQALVIHDLIAPLPYDERRRILRSAFPTTWSRPESGIALTEASHFVGHVWQMAEKHGHEGMVLKDAGDYPKPGNTRRWLKFRFSDQLNHITAA